mmetsp:Transcript_90753/g.256941  ORF Transcript_90753/g.256941 Transcript_90753/m.256941 type:complete len:215 (+) Transcript_90753:2240-2884(+)
MGRRDAGPVLREKTVPGRAAGDLGAPHGREVHATGNLVWAQAAGGRGDEGVRDHLEEAPGVRMLDALDESVELCVRGNVEAPVLQLLELVTGGLIPANVLEQSRCVMGWAALQSCLDLCALCGGHRRGLVIGNVWCLLRASRPRRMHNARASGPTFAVHLIGELLRRQSTPVLQILQESGPLDCLALAGRLGLAGVAGLGEPQRRAEHGQGKGR